MLRYATISREWLRLGCIGFGGPPTHITLLRRLCVEQRHWIEPKEFEDAIATTNLLPGPASTQLAIYCAWRLRGRTGAILGGLCFIVPGLILILALSAVFLVSHPPKWILGATAGAGAAVPAVALNAARGLFPASWKRIGTGHAQRARWVAYGMLGGAAAATVGPYLVLVLLGCGVTEAVVRRSSRPTSPSSFGVIFPAILSHGAAVGGLGALVWVAFKVGALSYGGGFVIVPLMQHDAVTTYHWMTYRRSVPQRCRPRADHAWACRADGGRGGLCGRGSGRWAIGSVDSFAPSSRSSWSAAGTSTKSEPTATLNRFSPGPDQPSSAPSPGRPFRSACPSAICGRSQCSPERWFGFSCSGVAS